MINTPRRDETNLVKTYFHGYMFLLKTSSTIPFVHVFIFSFFTIPSAICHEKDIKPSNKLTTSSSFSFAEAGSPASLFGRYPTYFWITRVIHISDIICINRHIVGYPCVYRGTNLEIILPCFSCSWVSEVSHRALQTPPLKTLVPL